MISRRVPTSSLISTLLVILSSGCAIFRPVGNAFSDGYENTVAYFNSYYNAKNIFDDAENEIVANEKAVRARDGITDQPVLIPQSARSKLTTVIDKCSNILSFHSGSAFVDDAVFLIGKSYFYQSEYLKAERKFVELLSLGLSPEMELEARLWYVRTLEKLKKDPEALGEAQRLVERSLAEAEEAIAGHASMILGSVYSRADDHSRSVAALQDAVRYGDDEVLRGLAQYRVGEELMQVGEYDSAAEAFLKVRNYSDEEGLILSAALKSVVAYRAGEDYELALNTCVELKDDYRFVNSIRSIEFEEALTLQAQGRIDQAIGRFIVIDTSGQRTALGCKAAFELARIYEERGDYQEAQAAYGRASGYPVPEIFAVARNRAQAFGRYHALMQERTRRDSILMSLAEGVVDSSLSERAPDSLRTLQAENAYELAEVFYADLEYPDSASSWYRISLSAFRDSVRTPRILYLLAELEQGGAEELKAASEKLYSQIIEHYPNSLYAMRAKVKLGMEVEAQGVDSAGIVYQAAERTIVSGEYESAIFQLRKIIDTYPLSPFAAKSAYAVGWLYEYRLEKPDSALAQYNNLIENFSGTPYATVLQRRLKSSGTTPPDSTRDIRKLEEHQEKPEEGTLEAGGRKPPVKVIQ